MATRKVAKALEVGHLDFDAALTIDQVGEMERAYRADRNGITRRVALAILTRSRGQLVAGLIGDDGACEAFTNELESLHGYIEQLDAIRETMDTARARLIVALQSVADGTTATA